MSSFPTDLKRQEEEKRGALGWPFILQGKENPQLPVKSSRKPEVYLLTAVLYVFAAGGRLSTTPILLPGVRVVKCHIPHSCVLSDPHTGLGADSMATE